MMTIKNLLKQIENDFSKAGVDSPAFDAMCLIEKVFDITRTDLIINGDKPADKGKEDIINSLAQRRMSGEPLQYILGSWNFFGYEFFVGEGVLIPRDDTEVLLSVCLEFLKTKRNPKVLDLCSGSGALAITIDKETDSQVTAVEKSPFAYNYLKKNADHNQSDVTLVKGDIFECMDMFEDNSFDLILSNPPYIKSDEIQKLQREINFEPRMALDGGADGYVFYRHIINYWQKKLKPDGMLAFELGENQFDTVKLLMEAQHFTNIGEKLDLGNIQRVIFGTLPNI